MALRDTRIAILKVGAEIVRTKGFNNTGLSEILSRSGVPKGSFYYYFNSKQDFGLHLVDYYAGFLLARTEDFLMDQSVQPVARLRRYFAEFKQGFEADGFQGGCPLGNVSQEMADVSKGFRERIEAVFIQLETMIESCLKEAKSWGEVSVSLDERQTATFILNSWEGAVLRMKVTKSTAPLEVFEQFVFGRLLQ